MVSLTVLCNKDTTLILECNNIHRYITTNQTVKLLTLLKEELADNLST